MDINETFQFVIEWIKQGLPTYKALIWLKVSSPEFYISMSPEQRVELEITRAIYTLSSQNHDKVYDPHMISLHEHFTTELTINPELLYYQPNREITTKDLKKFMSLKPLRIIPNPDYGHTADIQHRRKNRILPILTNKQKLEAAKRNK